MSIIVASKLVKEYHNMRAVNGVSFKVYPQECFGILGPNGAGKSSIAKMITGLATISTGELRIFGLAADGARRKIKARMGIVAQNNNLDTELTVLQNLIVYGSYFNIPADEAHDKSEELLDFFDLSTKRDARVEHLSGGMQRRLAIARALINDPQLVILDEPTTGLDPEARFLLWQKIERLKEKGVTLVLTTHYMEEASQLCDRLIIMDKGTILAEGSPPDLVLRLVGDQVLELGNAIDFTEDILERVQELVKGYHVIGDDLLLYPRSGQQLLELMQQNPSFYERITLRKSNLEDVFLSLTGRNISS